MSTTSAQLLQELQQLKKAVAHLAGTADLPDNQQLNTTALDKAAKQFAQLQKKRDNWVSSSDMGKYLKGAGWYNHKLVQEQFGFTAFIKIGRDFYYDREQLKLLHQELKGRQVNLEQFFSLIRHEAAFDKAYEKLKAQVRGKKTKKHFVVPEWLRDISTTPVKLPERHVVQADIDQLQQEFFDAKYGDYVDIHKGSFAMLKHIYPYERYLEKGLRRKLNTWCEKFNTTCKVLQEITGKKHAFIPVAPQDQIEL